MRHQISDSRLIFFVSALLASLPVVGFLIVSLPAVLSSHYDSRSFGGGDFLQYWSSYHLIVAGRNPYDPSSSLELQRSVGFAGGQAFMSWNPPWLPLLLSPVLNQPFPEAARTWMAANVLLLVGATALLAAAWRTRGRELFALLAAAIFFFPFWKTLELGQVSLLLCFAVALLYTGLTKDRAVVTGLALALLSIKPHLFYLILVVVGWDILRRRRWGTLVWSALFFGVFLMLPALLAPNLLPAWLSALTPRAPSPDYVSVIEWRSATLTGLLKDYFSHGSWERARAILVLTPLSIAGAVWCFLLVRRPVLQWHCLLPFLTVVSYLTAPYGWIFDQTVLLLPYLFTLLLCLRHGRGHPLTALLISSFLLVLQPLTWVLSQSVIRSHHQYFWFPLPLLVLFLGARLLCPMREEAPA